MTTEQLAWLAEEFCGAEVLEYADGTPYIWLLNGRELCKVGEFHPDTDPAHGDLVLRALAKRASLEQHGIMVYGWQTAWCQLQEQIHVMGRSFDFWPAVCLAALATKGGKT